MASMSLPSEDTTAAIEPMKPIVTSMANFGEYTSLGPVRYTPSLSCPMRLDRL